MALMKKSICTWRCLRRLASNTRSYATQATSPFAPRHLLSISDLSKAELEILIHNAFIHKQAVKTGRGRLSRALQSKTVAMMFAKRSTRTRVSTEAAVVAMGGHPMFLGQNDIQLGVNESLYDTSIVLSSMVSGIFARVDRHANVADLAKHSTVPVINGLSNDHHPLQTIADYLTLFEAFHSRTTAPSPVHDSHLGLDGLKIAWVGDANNVLFDLATAAMKLGVHLSVATPRSYGIPQHIREIILQSQSQSSFHETNIPEEAVESADVIVTDTWVSMGQELEAVEKMKAFRGFQVTDDLAKRGGAKKDWRFLHCLPRHPQEVDDAVFHGPKSLVFPEAENRLWAAFSALESFVVNRGRIARNIDQSPPSEPG
ncbi:MAG: hypothetical protein Q9162_006485 [Coniocarpon cinnabarinum]